MSATLTPSSSAKGSLAQQGYGSGVPGSPTHVPGFVVPGDGSIGLAFGLLAAATSTRGTLTLS